MDCLYCRHWNPDDEPRCQKCGRRLMTGAARPAPEGYVGATALAMAFAPAPVRQPVEAADTAAPAPPQRTQTPRQTRLFSESESGRVLQFQSTMKPAEP